ncbi:MAG: T9SS type A sorting domain-containing protein [Bacteroidetes bacterium]|nr:T9SS type A sorting domain-containing protein [Bacteroidota bacterium]
MKVYDTLGREVANLVDEIKEAGFHNSQFSIQNSQLPSGVYYYQLRTNGFAESKKLVVLK